MAFVVGELGYVECTSEEGKKGGLLILPAPSAAQVRVLSPRYEGARLLLLLLLLFRLLLLLVLLLLILLLLILLLFLLQLLRWQSKD